MNIVASIAVFFCCLFLLPQQAGAQRSIQEYRQIITNVTNNYVKLVTPYLNTKQREILKEIKFSLDLDQNIQASAWQNQNLTREVRITYGLLAIAENLHRAFAASALAKRPACFNQYISTAAAIARSNGTRQYLKEPLVAIPYFRTYVNSGILPCQGISEAMMNSVEVNHDVASSMNATLAILLGHEIAHHVLGHVDFPAADITSEQSRMREADADAWGMDRAFDIKINPIAASSQWLFVSLVGISEIYNDERNDHPPSIQRYLKFLDRIERMYDDPNMYFNKFSMYPTADMKAQLRAAKDGAKNVIALLKAKAQ